MRDLRFSRITILRDQVTGKAGEMVILHFLNGPFPAFDRFAGAGKVIIRLVTGLLARHLSLLNGVLKSPPLAVPQQRLQISRAPIFRAVLVALFELLKGFPSGFGGEFTHGHLFVQAARSSSMDRSSVFRLLETTAHSYSSTSRKNFAASSGGVGLR